VNGNGYDMDEKGLYEEVYMGEDEDGERIFERRYHQDAVLYTEAEKEDCVQESIEVSKGFRISDFAKEMANVLEREYDEVKILAKIKKETREDMVWEVVTDDMLTVDALYNDIVSPNLQVTRMQIASLRGDREYIKRAYPFCKYACIHHITEKNSDELITLASNLSKAWIKYLKEEIDSEHWYVGTESKYEDEEHTRKQLKDFEDALARLETYRK